MSLMPVAAFAQYGGGGSGAPTPPSVTNPPGQTEVKIIINDGAVRTTNTRVKLLMPQTSGDQMAISNSVDFPNVGWVPYRQEVMDWVLTPEVGNKDVFVKFRNSGNGAVTRAFSGSINLAAAGDGGASGSAATSTGDRPRDVSGQVGSGAVASCPLNLTKAYRAAGRRSVYYITPNCTKRPFSSPRIFFTYFTSWSDVIVTTESILNSVPNDRLGFMPLGPVFNPQYGALVKVLDDAKVYVLVGGVKRWIISEAVLRGLYYQTSWIEDVDSRVLDRFPAGGEIPNTTEHPNYTVIKFVGSPRVYRLQDGKKRHIANEAAFNRLGYRWDRIVVLPVGSFNYPDGDSLE